MQDVTLVTGANGALGAALVEILLGAGQSVIALERSRSGETRIAPGKPGLLRVEASTTSAEELEAALSRAQAQAGTLSGAVLTAGAWRGQRAFAEKEAASDFRVVMDANLEATSVALRAVLPGLVARRRGSVVLVGSRAGVRPHDAAGDAAYAASKAAVTALGQAVAAEVLAHGVRVNVVLPGTIDTEANRRAMPDADRSRWVTPESLADVIRFLLSDAARDVSGAAVPVYGRAGV